MHISIMHVFGSLVSLVQNSLARVFSLIRHGDSNPAVEEIAASLAFAASTGSLPGHNLQTAFPLIFPRSYGQSAGPEMRHASLHRPQIASLSHPRSCPFLTASHNQTQRIDSAVCQNPPLLLSLYALPDDG